MPIDDEDFVYADPPYDVEFTQYSREPFSWEDQERTAVMLARHRGPVVLVNQATPRIARLYRIARLPDPVSRRAEADQLHGKPHAGAGDRGDSKPNVKDVEDLNVKGVKRVKDRCVSSRSSRAPRLSDSTSFTLRRSTRGSSTPPVCPA